MNNTKKPSLIYILRVLQEYSDVNHFITQKEIIDKISAIYNVTYDRKTISASIDNLIALDYDIIKNPGGGYALASRMFERSEVQFLTDAIYSSKIISSSQSKELSNKLLASMSKYERKPFSNLYKTSDNSRMQNQELFLNLDIITDAIDVGMKISFQYTCFDSSAKPSLRYGGMNYIVSPYYLVNNFGKYYLISNFHKYDGISVYRLDHMTNVKLLKEDSKEEKLALGENFKIDKYLAENIYVFGGEAVWAKIKLYKASAIDYVLDWFGKSANIYHIDDEIFATLTVNENAFYYWAMQYSESIEVIEPLSVRNRIKENLAHLIERYK